MVKLEEWEINPKDFPENKSIEQQIKYLLRYAVLAPSTHNSQPWKFKIYNNTCQIFIDKTLSLKEADPKGKYIYMSVGALIENLIIASKYYCMFQNVKYYPSEDKNLVAEFIFKDYISRVDKEYEGLVTAIPKRLNARGLFKRRKIDLSVISSLRKINFPTGVNVSFITRGEDIKAIANLTAHAIIKLYGKKDFRKELSQWINSNLTGKRKGMPGYALRMPMLVSFVFPKLMKLVDMSKFISIANYKSMTTLPLICVISSKLDDPLNRVKIGMYFERLMLELYSRNINTSIFVASLEFDESREKIKNITKIRNKPQMLFGAGYLKVPQKHTPRDSVSAKLID